VGEQLEGAVAWPVPEQAVAVSAFATDGAADPLSMRPYAEVLADMAVARQTPTPLTVLIDGPWGSGKTTLTHMVEAEVIRHPGRWPQPHVFVRFDAWANEDAADLGTAFAAAVLRAAGRHRPLITRFLSPLPARLVPLQRRAARALAIYGPALLAAVAMAWWPPASRLLLSAFHLHPDQTSTAGRTSAHLASGTFAFAVVAYFRTLLQLPGLRDAAKWVKAPAEVAATGGVDTAAAQIRGLVAGALRGRRRLIVVVDNLDRCERVKALQICDTISHLIEAPGVVTFVAADAAELRAAVAERLRPQPEGEHDADRRAEADAMLDKMFSLRLRIPEMPSDRLWDMISHPPGESSARSRWIRPRVRRRIADDATAVLEAAARLYDANARLTPAALLEIAEVAAGNVAWSRSVYRAIDFAAVQLGGVAAPWMGPSAAARHRELFRIELGRANRVYFLTSVPRLAELDAAVQPWLRLPPRRAKRMYNHARLLYAVSLSRGVLGNPVRARDIGRWAVLSDAWPVAAEAIAREQVNLFKLVHHRPLGDSLRVDEIKEIFAAARMPAREAQEALAFLTSLMVAGEFDGFVLAVRELAGLLPAG
jgi:hypothetical protein